MAARSWNPPPPPTHTHYCLTFEDKMINGLIQKMMDSTKKKWLVFSLTAATLTFRVYYLSALP